MRIHVAFIPSDIDQAFDIHVGCVVIDMLRFTTTATQAIASGALAIHVAEDIETAQHRARACSSGQRPLLCGERDCHLIPGFDLGNSPYEFTPERVAGRELVFTTTNGTRAVQPTIGASVCLLASLVNLSAVVSRIVEIGLEDWWLICSGTNGKIAAEDVIAAGAVADRLGEIFGDHAELSQQAKIASIIWHLVQGDWFDLPKALQRFDGGLQLSGAGYLSDIDFACRIDTHTAVPTRPHGQSHFQ